MQPWFFVYETVTLPIYLSRPSALVDAAEVVVSLRQGAVKQDYRNPPYDADAGRIILRLTQEQTAAFSAGAVTIQVNIYHADGRRDTSAQAKIMALDNVYKEVMPNE